METIINDLLKEVEIEIKKFDLVGYVDRDIRQYYYGQRDILNQILIKLKDQNK